MTTHTPTPCIHTVQYKLDQAIEALNLWQAFWDDMPKGQLGKISCDIGLLNDAFIATSKALAKAKEQA